MRSRDGGALHSVLQVRRGTTPANVFRARCTNRRDALVAADKRRRVNGAHHHRCHPRLSEVKGNRHLGSASQTLHQSPITFLALFICVNLRSSAACHAVGFAEADCSVFFVSIRGYFSRLLMAFWLRQRILHALRQFLGVSQELAHLPHLFFGQ